MADEIRILGLACVLLLAHIFAAIHFKTRQYGVDWNMGARDEAMPPLNPVAGRLERARDNFLETFPIAIIALLGVAVSGRAGEMTAIGGWIWLGARAIYLLVYWAGIPKLRTFVFGVSMAGLVMALWPLLAG